MRDLHPEFQRLIQSSDISPVRMVELHTLPEPHYYWDGIGTLHYAGKNFEGVGALGEIDPITNSADAKAAQVNLTINTLGKIEDFSELRELVYQGQEILIHYGLMSTKSNELIVVEEGAFIGRMDELKVKTRAESSYITLTAVNEMTFLKKSWGRFQTDADHQADYPGDTSRRFLPSIQDVKIRI